MTAAPHACQHRQNSLPISLALFHVQSVCDAFELPAAIISPSHRRTVHGTDPFSCGTFSKHDSLPLVSWSSAIAIELFIEHVHIDPPVIGRHKQPSIGDNGKIEFRMVESHPRTCAVP